MGAPTPSSASRRSTKIDASNVKQLGLAWFVDLDTHRGQEATPLIIDGVLYSTSAWSKVQAIDAASGKLLWQYDPKVPGETGVKACCDTVNRGVAAYEGKMFLGTLDGRLVALDAATGNEVWSVVTVDQTKAYTITGAPRVIKGKVIIGNGGAEFGVRGYVSAYDAESGKMLWRFYTVPGDPSQPFEAPILEQAAKTWRGEWWKLGGGGTVWDSMAYDPELDLLYIGTGNGSPWNQQYRSPGGGDNLFLSSIVALKPDTGEYVWHYQSTPGETWDFTATQHIVLADLTIDGQPRKVLMQAPKNGFFYVIDRTNGKLISAKPFVPVNWASEIDLKTGRPVENPPARFMNPKAAGAGHAGAVRRAQLASDVVQSADRPGLPARAGAGHGVPAQSEVQATAARLQHRHRRDRRHDAGRSADSRRRARHSAWRSQGVGSGDADREVVGAAPGRVERRRALDRRQSRLPGQRRRRVRRVQRGGRHASSGRSRRRPASSPRRRRTRSAMSSTSSVLAGWGGTYAISGGDASRMGGPAINRSRVLAFKLGRHCNAARTAGGAGARETSRRSSATRSSHIRGKLHSIRSARRVTATRQSAAASCPTCAGRRSNRSEQAWREVVIDGARKDRGMVSFAPVMSAAEAESIRAYVIKRANDTYEATIASTGNSACYLTGRPYTSHASWGRSVSTWVAKPQVHAEL